MEVYDFRHIQDIANVIKYETLTNPHHKFFSDYLTNSNLGCEIEEGAMFPNAPAHAMPINFLLTKDDKKVAVLLMEKNKIKRYSVLETMALCEENNVTVCRFYFEYDNEEEYVINRIKKLFE